MSKFEWNLGLIRNDSHLRNEHQLSSMFSSEKSNLQNLWCCMCQKINGASHSLPGASSLDTPQYTGFIQIIKVTLFSSTFFILIFINSLQLFPSLKVRTLPSLKSCCGFQVTFKQNSNVIPMDSKFNPFNIFQVKDIV